MPKLSAAVLLLAAVLQAASYRADVEAFRQARAESIGSERGWAALTDLQWLDRTGEFTIGGAASNAIVLHAPSAPPRLGTLSVTDRSVTIRLAPGVSATMKGRAVSEAALTPDAGSADGLIVGDMTVALIDRSGRRALRVWDAQSAARRAFSGLQWYPIDEAWRMDARFVPHDPVPTIRIRNIVGQIVEMPNPGAAVFSVGGQEYRLEALLEAPDAGELFFMFRDATSAKTTYGAGRYLYTPPPKDGVVTLDFNEAMNPPCAFTAFATCPLPPASNRLPVAIAAGELDHE